MDDIPYLNVCSPSTTPRDDDAKLSRPRRSRKGQWRVAPPLPGARIYGPRCSARIELHPRIGAEVYIEVRYVHGRFWVRHDASVLDLLTKLREGGFMIAPPLSGTGRGTVVK